MWYNNDSKSRDILEYLISILNACCESLSSTEIAWFSSAYLWNENVARRRTYPTLPRKVRCGTVFTARYPAEYSDQNKY